MLEWNAAPDTKPSLPFSGLCRLQIHLAQINLSLVQAA